MADAEFSNVLNEEDASARDVEQADSATLEQMFNELMNQNELLAKENRLFDSYLQRKVGEVNWDEIHKEVNKGRNRRTDWSLNQYQKYNIALAEHEFRTKQLKALEAKAAEDIGLLKAIVEGIKIRINEMRKETYEFKRDIVIGGENQQTGTIMAEKVIHYYEEKLKQKTALVEKIKLKNAAMKNHRGKMDAQVKHKEEQGDSLHSIDFHQLQIKNSQFNQKINERNTELLKLKMTTGKTVQVLNTAKKNLSDLLHEQKSLRTDIKDRHEAMVKLSEELELVDAEVQKEQKKNKKYKIQQSNPDMPQVLDYVNQKSSMYDLDAEIRNWKRKVEIAELGARRARGIIKAAEAGTLMRPYSGPSRGGGGGPGEVRTNPALAMLAKTRVQPNNGIFPKI